MKKLLIIFLCAFGLSAQAATTSVAIKKSVTKVKRDQCTKTITRTGTMSFYCAYTGLTTTQTLSSTCTATEASCQLAESTADACASRSLGLLTAAKIKEAQDRCQDQP